MRRDGPRGAARRCRSGGWRIWGYDQGSAQFTQQDPIGVAGGLNLYGYADGDPINFSDPFGLCPAPRPCPAGEISKRAGVPISGVGGLALLSAAMELAEQTGKHVRIQRGRRGHNPNGSNNASEHRMDLGGDGAFDFHLFNANGTQLADSAAVRLIQRTGGMPSGSRLIYHGRNTNTEAEHLHMDLRTDIGNRNENGGTYTVMRNP